MTASDDVEDAFADGRLFVVVDPPRPHGNRSAAFAGCNGIKYDAPIRFVHVVSKPAGGEIRGYVLTEDGVLRGRVPCYTGDWPEIDAAVLARVAGARSVLPVGAGGVSS